MNTGLEKIVERGLCHAWTVGLVSSARVSVLFDRPLWGGTRFGLVPPEG
jgi:hypothetical protein